MLVMMDVPPLWMAYETGRKEESPGYGYMSTAVSALSTIREGLVRLLIIALFSLSSFHRTLVDTLLSECVVLDGMYCVPSSAVALLSVPQHPFVMFLFNYWWSHLLADQVSVLFFPILCYQSVLYWTGCTAYHRPQLPCYQWHDISSVTLRKFCFCFAMSFLNFFRSSTIYLSWIVVFGSFPIPTASVLIVVDILLGDANRSSTSRCNYFFVSRPSLRVF
jgi:hypothetical protein